ncbi:hypothetical protein NEOLEDRAFT_1106344 [Neolentinus lepideus HHB14362 ss-1]|uniref:Arrestin-like N-terminal domain-containing protein n=1 Tax=Neolentinus lepideus HHB14362 ss-1 TaxID=1314782 RepID=A0A165VJ84_9AGAM|nr:hypothetical protein NEOLEDRAFT_1106344 [Neolentinus lepideus HHB14362 ss-1]
MNGKAWATLKLKSRARSPTLLPAYYEGDPITGSLDLHLPRSDPIKAIFLKVVDNLTYKITGRIINTRTTGNDVFFRLEHTIWSTFMGHPRDTGNSESSSEEYNAKLKGSYSWPFSIDVPREVHIKGIAYPLPPTFQDRNVQCTVQYNIIVHLARGRLRTDSKFGTAIGFIPYRRPPPPSVLRQLSYLRDLPLVTPEEDNDGWTSLHSLQIPGTIFKIRPVRAKCELWIANPVCYTRGSVIPCFLNIRTDDHHMLDLLSSPKAPKVRLVQSVGFQANNSGVRDIRVPASRIVINVTSTSVVSTATWWPSTSRDNPSQNERSLQGELHLPPDLAPTCSFPGFVVSYSIVMHSFEATGYAPASRGMVSLASLAVEIVTAHSAGPRARRYAPPSYRPATPPRQFPLDIVSATSRYS